MDTDINPQPPSNPSTIGRFKVESLLGKGGMGEVYKAFDPLMRRIVAIKIVRPEVVDASNLERFRREAQAYGRLKHPHIVTVHEANEDRGSVFIVMEYLDGQGLATALGRGTLSFESKLKILIEMLDALQYAHGEGVIHRDIKPTNVHLMPSGAVKLLDFGLARAISAADTLTQAGARSAHRLMRRPNKSRVTTWTSEQMSIRQDRCLQMIKDAPRLTAIAHVKNR